MRILLVLLLILLIVAACGRNTHSVDTEVDTQLSRLEALPVPAGISAADWDALRSALAAQLKSGAKTPSDAPTTNASASVLDLTDNGAAVTLEWSYAAQGDYDQNGEVNVSDLTPLGAHFRETSAGGPFPYDSILSQIDGDGNGEINVADVTPIAANFGSQVTGYRLYSTTVFTDIPTENDGFNGPAAQLLETIALSAGSGSGRKQFSFDTSSNPPGTYYWVRPTDGTLEGTASNYTVPAGDTLIETGGAVNLNGIQLEVNPQDLIGDVKFTITSVAPPPGLPADASALAAYEITPDYPDRLNAPVTLTIPYDDSTLGGDEEGVMALHYNGSEYEPMTRLALDTIHNTLTVNTRTFSTITVMDVKHATFNALAADYNVGFDIAKHGWPIHNFGSYVSPGGNCLGMSAYACWFFAAHFGEKLSTKFSTQGGEPVSIAHLMATRSHMAQSQVWSAFKSIPDRILPDSWMMNDIKYDLSRFGKPLVLLLFGTGGNHACVIYGWDSSGLLFYDVNFPEDGPQHLSLGTNGKFNKYQSYTGFGYVTQATCGKDSDFANLTQQGEDGFTSSSQIDLEKPEALASVETYIAQVKGTVAGTLSGQTELACYVNGQRQLVPITADAFDSYIAPKPGPNTVVLIANGNEKNNWYPECATLVRSFTATIATADLIVTMTYDKPRAFVDLFVYEPNWWVGGPDYVARPGLAATRHSLAHSGILPHYYGPEVVSLYGSQGGQILEGNYWIRVHYYGQHVEADGVTYLTEPLTGRVTVVTHQGLPNQTIRTYPFTINTWDEPNASNWNFDIDEGPWWADITNVRLID